MFGLRNQYLKDIKKYGYPCENETGRGFDTQTFHSLNAISEDYLYMKIFPNGGNNQDTLIITVTESKNGSVLTYNPSYWFLSHYVYPKNYGELDSTLFLTLKKGVDALKVEPMIIIVAYESTQQPKNEFAISYYSQLWAYKLKFSHEKKFHLPQKTKNSINANRNRYFIPSIEKEKKLMTSLYKLIEGKQITDKQIKKMNTKYHWVTLFVDYM